MAESGISMPKIVQVTDIFGRVHKQVVKGKDDLRQDAVMQQLCTMLNSLFSQTASTRDAGLRLRCYKVVPLSPCAGLAEWVTGTNTIGNYLTGSNDHRQGAHYRYRPKDLSHPDCRERMKNARETCRNADKLPQKLLEAFEDVCKRFQPVMHLFFLERFPRAALWHQARSNYLRSVAVISMVGFVLGLGDRHVNNVLLDLNNGEMVNIDFGILFEAGKALAVPELVPFRLTRDMISGLGCLGIDGPFRKCCEIALSCLRNCAPLVLSVVEVFAHDPLYRWSCAPRKQLPEHAEIGFEGLQGMGVDGNDLARRVVLTIKTKLTGVDDRELTRLDVPAHVREIKKQKLKKKIMLQKSHDPKKIKSLKFRSKSQNLVVFLFLSKFNFV